MDMLSLKENIKAMPVKQRALLARFILSTLEDGDETPDDLEALWYSEAERRREAYLNGSLKTIPMEEAFAKARQEII